MSETSSLHVCHVLLRLTYGGMENGVVTIANRLRDDGIRHSVLCIDGATAFRHRLADDVPVRNLEDSYRSQLGKMRAVRAALRELRPDVVHTRNLPTIDLYPAVLAAGVRRIVHSEHGVDLLEAEGSPLKYRLVRRVGGLIIPAYIALSGGLRDWMAGENGIPARKIRVIVNGVDTARFRPPTDEGERTAARQALGIEDPNAVVVGSLGRLEAIKDHENLAQAFVALIEARPELAGTAVLAIGGDGSRGAAIRAILDAAGLGERLVMPGYTSDSPGFYRALDLFVLPSRSEGTSNTILEAMASGLPVVATDVGEARRLIDPGTSGALVPPRDPGALAAAIGSYVSQGECRAAHGRGARERAQDLFGLDAMLAAYRDVYRGVAG